MANLQYVLDNVLDTDNMPSDVATELEELVSECNVAYAKGEPIVEDSVYDYLKDKLQQVMPDSSLLNETYEETAQEAEDVQEGTDDEATSGIQSRSDPRGYFSAVGKWGNLLEEHPMMSIQTIKSFNDSEFWDFINILDPSGDSVFCSYKINGHGIRLVYNDGDLVSATSRARRGRGSDILDKVSQVVPTHNPDLEGLGEVEIRGELCLPLANLNKAREYNPDIKSAFSAVSSLLGADSGEYVKLLDLLAYNVYTQDGLSFDKKSDEYDWLANHGFRTPECAIVEFSAEDLSSGAKVLEAFKEVLGSFEESYDDFGYFCDGLVVQVDDNARFAELGDDGVRNFGNIALKVGLWKQEGYVGRVVRIEWTKGMSKMSPVAIVEDPDNPGSGQGVLVAQGNRPSRVPLYEPANILVLGVQPGSMLHFNYGGESAVVPTDESGRPLKNTSATERFNKWLENNVD